MGRWLQWFLWGIIFLLLLLPFTLATSITNPPSVCNGLWSSCSNAFADGGSSSTVTPTKNSNWLNYGFSVPSGSTVQEVMVRADFFASKTNGYIDVKVSKDGGNTYGATHHIGGNTAEQTFWINVTNDLSWTPDGLNNSNFRVNVTCVKQGSGKTPTCNLDYIPVRINYQEGSAPDTTPPHSVTNLNNQSEGTTWLYWTWTNPSDPDFFQNIIYVDGIGQLNTSNAFYNKTGLSPNTIHTITVHTKDNAGNINNTDVNNTAQTEQESSPPDTTPPHSITNLDNQSQTTTSIYWTWTNPSNPDFFQNIIYLDGIWRLNTSNNFWNATNLNPDTLYTITVHTKDTSGNINNTDVNDTARTLPNPSQTQCNDTVDNSDRDTLTDYPADPGCSSASDNDETDGVCDDNVDDSSDSDSLADASDLGCTSFSDTSEVDGMCDDTVDDASDSDSLADGSDPGCTSFSDADEADGQCDDSIDNGDRDSLIDYPNDAGCSGFSDNDEIDAMCDDNIDDTSDSDSLGDASDPGCSSFSDTSEADGQCDDTVDNSDRDTLVDYPSDLGCVSFSDSSETDGMCDDTVDDVSDSDSLADGPDPGCSSFSDTTEIDALCDNKLDDDADTKIDFNGINDDGVNKDPGCSGYGDNNETDGDLNVRYPHINYKVAFIADTGTSWNGDKFDRVLQVIRDEKANMTMVAGDLGYNETVNWAPEYWMDDIENILDPWYQQTHPNKLYPIFWSLGNHDKDQWEQQGDGVNTPRGYRQMLNQRFSNHSITSNGNPTEVGTKSSFAFNNLFVVQTAPGENNCNFCGGNHAQFIEEQIRPNDYLWDLSMWHKNMEVMQVGDKIDATGWDVYETSRRNGALIQTAHEHSYHRTFVLDNMSSQHIADNTGVLTIKPNSSTDLGQTFTFVSGMAGRSRNYQKRCGPIDPPYGCNGEWAKIYTANQSADYGALFIIFNFDGDPRTARGYFKDIQNRTADNFTLYNDAPGTTPLIAKGKGNPTSGLPPLTVSFTGDFSGGVAPHTFFWDFKDGQTSTQQNPSHTFNNNGVYNVSFRVTDSQNNQNTNYIIITVSNSSSEIKTYNPIADSYVREKYPTTNFGTNTLLLVDYNTSDISYLKFNLSDIAGRTVNSAKLRLYVTNSGPDKNLKRVSDDSWQENTINYNNRPAVGNLVQNFACVVNQWKEIDVTSPVQEETGQLFSLAADTTNTDGCDFQSRENTNKPELVVNVTTS